MTSNVSLKDVAIGVFTPRMVIDPRWVEDLADDIRRNGQQKPIIVQDQSEPPYPVIDGEHRVYAIKKLGYKSIRAEIRKLSDEEALFLAMRINEMHGLRLDALEEGRQMFVLQKEFGWSEEKLGERYGHKQQWVSDRINLYLRASPELKSNITTRAVMFSQAREIAKLPESEQPTVLEKVVDEELSTKQTKLLTYVLRKADEKEKVEILEKPVRAIAELYSKPDAFEKAVKTSMDKPMVEWIKCPSCGQRLMIDWVERKISGVE